MESNINFQIKHAKTVDYIHVWNLIILNVILQNMGVKVINDNSACKVDSSIRRHMWLYNLCI